MLINGKAEYILATVTCIVINVAAIYYISIFEKSESTIIENDFHTEETKELG